MATELRDDARVTLGFFAVGGHTCALDVTQLREVVRWQPATPLPRAPRLIDGVIDLRGSVVPVVDLARALGRAALEPGPRARIAVVQVGGCLLGLAVEGAVAVDAVAAADLAEPPALAAQAGYVAARAVLRRPDAEPVPLLSLEHLLERVIGSGELAEGAA